MEPGEEKTETPGEPEEESFGEMLDRTFVAPTRYEPGQEGIRPGRQGDPGVGLPRPGPEGRRCPRGEGAGWTRRGPSPVKEGDSLEAYFVSSDGSEMLFTTRVAGGRPGRAQLEDASNSGIPVDGQSW